MAVQRVKDGDSLIVDINTGKTVGKDSVLADDRPWRIYYNKYGEAHRLPADPAQFQIFIEQGWSVTKPRKPAAKPKEQRMRDGSIFSFEATSKEVSEAERLRMNMVPAGQMSGPTATYYSQNGDVLPNLPADPASMKAYLEMGLSLTPPANAAVSA